MHFTNLKAAAAGSFMNTVIITSVLSAGNHALYAGTRVLYGLATAEPAQAPRIFSWTTAQGVPLPALLATASISILCFGSSYIGTGQVWGWLQNIVGVSNQVRWFLPVLVEEFWLMGLRRLRGSPLEFRVGGSGKHGLAKAGSWTT